MTDNIKNEVFGKIVLNQWNSYTKKGLQLLETLSELQFNTEIEKGANTPSWIFGHLAETHDALFPLLEIRPLLYPEMKEMYVHNHATPSQDPFTKERLTEVWKEIHTRLDNSIRGFSAEQWFERHTAVSQEEFVKEPHRNKINIILSRTTHMAHHLGQVSMATRK